MFQSLLHYGRIQPAQLNKAPQGRSAHSLAKGGEFGMTDFQMTMIMIALAQFVSSFTFGSLGLIIAILNLLNKK